MGIAEIHGDIIQTHILTRLDGQTLAAAGCASSQLHSLSTHHKLWSDICATSWPSTGEPLILEAISNFPSGHRSFFSDSFPSPCHRLTTAFSSETTTTTSHLISAVDMRYLGELVFSKAESTDTTSEWFEATPFRVDLLEPKEVVSSAVKLSGGGDDDESLKSNLERGLSLSWIVIDPVHNRSVNLSSVKPVSVNRNWLTGDVQVRFSVVVAVDHAVGGPPHGHEYVNCNIEVTCGVNEEGGELHVRGVSLTFQDMDGKSLNGKDSMVILQGMMETKRKRRNKWKKEGEEEKERYEKYMEKVKERKERKERRERRLDMLCVASGVALFLAFWSYVLY